jgi:hypothetical protein
MEVIQNMTARLALIQEGSQVLSRPWSVIGRHPGMIRELSQVSGELTDVVLAKICAKLKFSRTLAESILISNIDRFYTVLSGWLRSSTPVVELKPDVEEALHGALDPLRVADSSRALREHPGIYVVTGFDERRWLRHLVHGLIHEKLSVSSSLRQVLTRLSRIHVFVESTAQGLRFMVCAFDLIDMDWQVPLSTLSFCSDDWMERQQQGLKERPHQHVNPWFLSLMPEGTPPEQSMFWLMVAFGVFVPLLGVATMALAATLAARRVTVTPAGRSPSRRERAGRPSGAIGVRQVWLDAADLSAYVRSLAPAPPPPGSTLAPIGAPEGEPAGPASPRTAHAVRAHVARYWVLLPAQDEPRVDQRAGPDGRVLYCVERPRRSHVRGQGDLKIVERVQRMGLTGST